jgi:hypothetical protein
LFQAQPQPDQEPLLSTKDLSIFLTTSQAFARNLMKELDIPKRGKGYPRARLLAAFGFAPPLPLGEQGIWRPLLDAKRAAVASGGSAKTFGRMFDGSHRDPSFRNYIHLGPRKRLIFAFELEAWMSGASPKFERDIGLMHPLIRGMQASPPPPVKQNLSTPVPGPQPSATAFSCPKRSTVIDKTFPQTVIRNHLLPVAERRMSDMKRHQTEQQSVRKMTFRRDIGP